MNDLKVITPTTDDRVNHNVSTGGWWNWLVLFRIALNHSGQISCTVNLIGIWLQAENTDSIEVDTVERAPKAREKNHSYISVIGSIITEYQNKK